MLDGENPTREELIKYLDEEIARLEAEEQLANSQEIDDTKHSKQGAFSLCDGHVTNLTGESPVVGSYRQAQ